MQVRVVKIPWAQLEVGATERGQLQVQVSGGIGGRSTRPRLVEGATVDEVRHLTRALPRLSREGRGLPADLERLGRTLYLGLTGGEVGQVIDQLRGEGHGHLLLRLVIADPTLGGLAWEAMRGPSDMDGAVACHPHLRVVRGVFSTEPAVRREVRRGLRLLVVAPGEMAAVAEEIRVGLAAPIGDGRVEWLDPAVRRGAGWMGLLARLGRPPRPHAIHFACHGRVNAGGEPELLLDPEESRWTPVRTLATALAGMVGDDLRVVYLEACEGAEPGTLASAAEHLSARGVEAVVAHLWSIDSRSARFVADTFYDALTGDCAGDAAASLNRARLAMAGIGTVDHLCPVLVMRGHDPVVFDFTRRQATPNPARPLNGPGLLPPALLAVAERVDRGMRGPSTLIVGEYADADGTHSGLRQIEREVLSLLDRPDREPLSALLQRFELTVERDELRATIQEVLDRITKESQPGALALIDGLARLARPGLFITLLWLPLLEDALAAALPDRELIVLQPLKPGGTQHLRVFRREAGSGTWERLKPEGLEVDFSRQLVILRLYGGYTAAHRTLLGDPVLTDDDHLLNLASLDDLPPRVLAFLRNHPANIVGLSPLSWAHREMLRRLLGDQPLVPGSLAVLRAGADEPERRYWQSAEGPAGRSGGVDLVEFEELAAVLTGLR